MPPRHVIFNNWYQPDPHSQFNIPPYVFIQCHETPLHVNGIAAADEFASFSFQKRWNNPGDPIWVRCWYILYHTPFAPKCFSTNTKHIPSNWFSRPPPPLPLSMFKVCSLLLVLSKQHIGTIYTMNPPPPFLLLIFVYSQCYINTGYSLSWIKFMNSSGR